jgi:hypothetical protein
MSTSPGRGSSDWNVTSRRFADRSSPVARGSSFRRAASRVGTSPPGDARQERLGKLRVLSKEVTVVLIWVLVALLLLFAIVGGIAITKFLFFVLIVAALLALIGFFARTA